jgi:hypothetical protein
MRAQYCRKHIDQTAKECGLEKKTVDEVKRVADFCDQHSEISDLSSHAIMPLIRERNGEVREKAILSVKNLIELRKDAKTGKFKKKITQRDIRAVLNDVRKEILPPQAQEETTKEESASKVETPSTYTEEKIDLLEELKKKTGLKENTIKSKLKSISFILEKPRTNNEYYMALIQKLSELLKTTTKNRITKKEYDEITFSLRDLLEEMSKREYYDLSKITDEETIEEKMNEIIQDIEEAEANRKMLMIEVEKAEKEIKFLKEQKARIYKKGTEIRNAQKDKPKKKTPLNR